MAEIYLFFNLKVHIHGGIHALIPVGHSMEEKFGKKNVFM